MRKLYFLHIYIILFAVNGFSQTKTIKGIVKDIQSDEPIPFASVILKSSGTGSLTDSSGKFGFQFSNSLADTLLVTSVGYKPVAFVIPSFTDSAFLTIAMEIAPVGKEAVVKVKYNRALWLWNRVMKNKKLHDRSRYNTYSYEIYNKLELDLNNVNKEKLAGKKLLKPFNFILNNVDTTEEKPFLPVFLTETISDFYFQRSPRKIREEIRASNKFADCQFM